MPTPDSIRRDFQARVEPHGVALVRFLRRLVPPSTDARDVLQSALASAFAAHARFDPESSFRSWIYKFATNEALNENRRGRRRREQLLDQADVAVDAPDIDLELCYERVLADPDTVLGVIDEPLARALAVLDPRVRATFLLRTLVDMSCTEIAATLSVPKGTVVSWLFRARTRLRQQLTEDAREHGLAEGVR